MTVDAVNDLARMLDPALLMEDLGLVPDDWQRRVLRSEAERMLLLAARQSGKSTAVAVLALHAALYQSGALVLLISPGLRQSGELFRKTAGFYADLGRPLGAVEDSATTLALSNGARVVSLPGTPATVRGFSAPKLVVIDEAALVDDGLFIALHPMLATGKGRLICLSTPMGRRGQFWRDWHEGGASWERFRVTAEQCPRIDPAFLAEQRRILGDRWHRQEYLCSFEETIGQVFSTEAIEGAFTSDEPPLFGSPVASRVGIPADSRERPLFAS